MLEEPGGCKGRSHPCTGMACSLGQDAGKARVSPVSTRGFPDPCPGIVCLRMSHLWSPWFPPFPATLACPTLSPCQLSVGQQSARAQFCHCQPTVHLDTGSATAPGLSPWPVSVWGLR